MEIRWSVGELEDTGWAWWVAFAAEVFGINVLMGIWN